MPAAFSMRRKSRRQSATAPSVVAVAPSIVAVLAALAAIGGGPAAAQLGLPGPAQPGQIEERFRPIPTPPPASSAPVIQTPVQPTPPGAEAQRFHLAEIRLQGSTVYPPGALRPLYADLLGREVSFAEIIDLANRMTARYRADGYILSQVVVPEQDVTGGVVKLVAVEGYVDKVTVDGAVKGPRSLVDAFTDDIRAVRPLTAAALERNLLLIGDLPGVNVQSVLSPSPTAYGAADLRVTLTHLPAQGFVAADNRGSRFVGPWIASAGVSEFSLLGGYEQIDLLAAATPGSAALRYLGGQLTVPIGPLDSGDTLQLFASGTRDRPDLPGSLFPFNTRGDDVEARATYFHPFIRSRPENLSGRLSFIWHDERTRLTDLPGDARNPTEDQVRVLQARATYDVVDGWSGVNLADLSVNTGLPILGASDAGGRDSRLTGASGTFTYLNGTLSRQQTLGGGWGAFAAVNAQYSFNPLLLTERFGVGGSQFGRGFAPGNITGDHGVAAKVELQYGDRPQIWGLDSYQAYAFFDIGRTWDIAAPQTDNRLSSTGLGVRINLTDKISINPEIAHQLSGLPVDAPGAKHETRGLVSLVARF